MRACPQFPELTELGGLRGLTPASIAADVAKVKTPFAFATAPFQTDNGHGGGGYLAETEQLAKAGWECLGNRYNALHGPSYISLWWLRLPANKPQAMNPQGGYAGYYVSGPAINYPPGYRYASACCGLHLGEVAHQDLGPWRQSQFLQLLRVSGSPREIEGYKLIAECLGVNYYTNSNQGNFSKRCICQ